VPFEPAALGLIASLLGLAGGLTAATIRALLTDRSFAAGRERRRRGCWRS
jgi:hypothetical protein